MAFTAEYRSNAKAALLAIGQQANAIPHEVETTDETRSQGSFLSRDVEDEIRRKNASLFAWLTSVKGMLFQILLLSMFVVMEVVIALLTSRVLKADTSVKVKPLASNIPPVISGISLLIGIVVTVLMNMAAADKASSRQAIAESFSRVFNLRAIVRMAPVAVVLGCSAVFNLLVYTRLDAGTKRMLDQLKLPATAAFSYAVVGRKYSLAEWCALSIILLSVVSFYSAKVEQDNIRELHYKCNYPGYCFPGKPQYDLCALRVDGASVYGEAVGNSTQHDVFTFPIKAGMNDNTGLCFSMVALTLSCIGGLLTEKYFKDDASTPFPTQMAHLNFTIFPVAMAMSFIVPLYVDNKGGQAIWWRDNGVEGSGAGYFQGFTLMTVFVVSIHLLLAWMGGLITKQFSTVVKIIAKCGAMILTIVFDGTVIKPCHADPVPLAMYAIALIIAFDTALLSFLPKPKKVEAPLLPTEVRDVVVERDERRTEMQSFPSGRA
eukprot:TRINITY_DN47121_c0_g1_i1.p1 TRINITY_DN47121_c0_g1~~TRINITY_DN47121_c0_g1_i1.p1  ORF type:complete len:504 (-),score=80.45 TRINITY_DN47121_c0_g1_i1:345-1814(-)